MWCIWPADAVGLKDVHSPYHNAFSAKQNPMQGSCLLRAILQLVLVDPRTFSMAVVGDHVLSPHLRSTPPQHHTSLHDTFHPGPTPSPPATLSDLLTGLASKMSFIIRPPL